MGILLLLPFLVSGYWICVTHPRIALSFHRYEGQLLYLLVAREGIHCFLVAALLSLLLIAFSHVSFTLPGCEAPIQVTFDYFSRLKDWLVRHEMAKASNADIHAFLLQAAALCLIVPTLLTRFAVWQLKRSFNLKTRAELDAQLLALALADSPLLNLLMTSIRYPDRKYMFTMSDRKVYIGNVIDIGKATEAQGVDQHFQMVPFLSGYRDKDTLQVEMTTDYAKAGDGTITLSQENIVSAMLWKENVWAAFKADHEGKKAKTRLKDRLPKRGSNPATQPCL